MAAVVDTKPSQDYLSQHFEQTNENKLKETKSFAPEPQEDELVFTTTPNPPSSKPMSQSRVIAMYLIAVSHAIALYAIYDMFFNLDAVSAIKWFLASYMVFQISGVQGVTAGAHRLWAHRSYTAAFPVRVWLMLMNCIANQGPIITWATEHRIHHLHVDTDADPHNINRGFFFAHMGWLFTRRTDAFAKAKKHTMVEDLYADPVAAFQNKYYLYLSVFFCYILPTLLAHFYCGDAFRGFVYLANFRWVISLQSTWCVNSVSHVFGSKPYSPEQEATDNYFTAIISGGEGWHNFHHTYASDYRACEQDSQWSWNDPSGFNWRFNSARTVIDFFAALGGVSNRRVFPVSKKVQ